MTNYRKMKARAEHAWRRRLARKRREAARRRREIDRITGRGNAA